MRPGDNSGRGDDGVRVSERAPRRRPARTKVAVLVAVVVAAVLAAGVLGWSRLKQPASETLADASRVTSTPLVGEGLSAMSVPAVNKPGSGMALQNASRPVDGEDPTPDLSDYVLPGEAPTMAQVIKALHARGIRTGLGAFPPPGTSPPLHGLAVPDGFPLPDGYVRHHQATDDGQSIAAILMFAPDREWIDIRGTRVRIPADRVVTPELAPPGMPLRWVDIPPPRDTGGRP